MLIGNTNEVLIPYFVFTTPSHQPHHTEPLILVGMQLAVTTDQVRSPSVTLLIMTMVMLFMKMLLMVMLLMIKQDQQRWRYHRRLFDYQSPYFQLKSPLITEYLGIIK